MDKIKHGIQARSYFDRWIKKLVPNMPEVEARGNGVFYFPAPIDRCIKFVSCDQLSFNDLMIPKKLEKTMLFQEFLLGEGNLLGCDQHKFVLFFHCKGWMCMMRRMPSYGGLGGIFCNGFVIEPIDHYFKPFEWDHAESI